MLSAEHSDAVTATVVQGDLQVGDATPEWNRLPAGAANTFLGSDGTELAYYDTVPLATAVLADNAVIRGDGGARGIQDSSVLINDADEMSGLTLLDIDQLRLDGDTISIVGGNHLVLDPATGHEVWIAAEGNDSLNIDALQISNAAWASSMISTRTSILFTQAYNSGGSLADSARITVGTETNWTVTGSTQDAYMAFHTAEDGTVGEKVRINSVGAVGINTDEPGGLHASALLDIRRDALCAFAVYAFNSTAVWDSRVFGCRARGSDGSAAAVQDADRLFTFQALGYDGSAYKTGGYITFVVDGAVSSGVVPGSILFYTTAGVAPALRLTIQSDGDILVDSGTSLMWRDSGLLIYSSADGQLDIDADVEVEITAPTVELTASSAIRFYSSNIYIQNFTGIDWLPGSDRDVDVFTIAVTGTPKYWWDESGNAFAMTHRLILPEGVQTKYATDDVADPPTDAELDAAFGDPTVVGAGFIGVLDDNDAGTDCYICWTTGTAGEWFYVKGTKAV